MGHTTIAAYRPAKIHSLRQIAAEAVGPSLRPSWFLLIIVTAAVAGLTWGIMQQRMPEIDPRQVIAINLSAAELAMESGRYLDPPEHSAMHYFSSALALDPDNPKAVSGLDLLAIHFIDEAKTAILDARFAEAALAIENVRRVQPTNRRLEFLDSQLRKAIDAHVAALQSDVTSSATNASDARPPIKNAETPRPVTAAPRESSKAPAAATRTEHLLEAEQIAAVTRVEPEPSSEGVARPDSRTRAYADVARAYETATQQLALQARARTSVPSGSSRTRSEPTAESVAKLSPPAVWKALKLVEPHYPEAAQVRGIEGWVDLTLTVSGSGDVIDARVEDREGSRSFERAALLAVRQWKYEPHAARDSDVPPEEILVRVAFELE